VTDALFTRDGDHYRPSEYTRGPWRPDAQHGGPPAALLAHLGRPHEHDDEFAAHIEVELVRPVPLEPLTARVDIEPVSGRVRRLRAELLADGTVVARSTTLLLRRSDPPPPEWHEPVGPALDPPPPDRAVDPPRWGSGERTAYHRNGVEHRITEGHFGRPGPAVDWVRLRLSVVAGEEPAGMERALAAADFGSGISALYGSSSSFGLINANLAVAFHRPPTGEWISLDALTRVGDQGTGLCVSTLGDLDGPFGVATQSLLGYDFR